MANQSLWDLPRRINWHIYAKIGGQPLAELADGVFMFVEVCIACENILHVSAAFKCEDLNLRFWEEAQGVFGLLKKTQRAAHRETLVEFYDLLREYHHMMALLLHRKKDALTKLQAFDEQEEGRHHLIAQAQTDAIWRLWRQKLGQSHALHLPGG